VATECVVTSPGGERLLGDRTFDLSWDGARVACFVPAQPGEPVKASIRVPETGVWVHGTGYVARVVPGRRAGDDCRSIGIRLTHMDGMSRTLLASYVERHPPPPPSRGTHRDYARIVQRIASGG